jgi:isovaleryl-CoA dehydrogenase
MGQNVFNDSGHSPRLQVLGGNGYTGDYVVERLWRDAKLLEIGGGTVEAHEKNMARDLSKIDRLP